MLIDTSSIVFQVLLGIAGLIGIAFTYWLIKRQQTAAFRQEWINNLRKEIASFLSKCKTYHYAQRLARFNKLNDKFSAKDIAELGSAIVLSINMIKLMINPDEEDHSRLVTLLVEYNGLITTNAPEFEKIIEIKDQEIVALSQVILKREWEVVKFGEPIATLRKKYKQRACF